MSKSPPLDEVKTWKKWKKEGDAVGGHLKCISWRRRIKKSFSFSKKSQYLEWKFLTGYCSDKMAPTVWESHSKRCNVAWQRYEITDLSFSYSRNAPIKAPSESRLGLRRSARALRQWPKNGAVQEGLTFPDDFHWSCSDVKRFFLWAALMMWHLLEMVFFSFFFRDTVKLVALCGTCAMEEISRFSNFIIYPSARSPSPNRTQGELFLC